MSPREWVRLAERKEKEAKKLLQEAQAFRLMASQDNRLATSVPNGEL